MFLPRDTSLSKIVIDHSRTEMCQHVDRWFYPVREEFLKWTIENNIGYQLWTNIKPEYCADDDPMGELKIHRYWAFNGFTLEMPPETIVEFYLRWS
jgi:hypothetical protein